MAAIIGGRLEDLALPKSAEESFTTTRNPIDHNDLGVRDALRAADAHNVALVGVPSISGLVCRQRQGRLDALRRFAAGGTTPTGQQSP